MSFEEGLIEFGAVEAEMGKALSDKGTNRFWGVINFCSKEKENVDQQGSWIVKCAIVCKSG